MEEALFIEVLITLGTLLQKKVTCYYLHYVCFLPIFMHMPFPLMEISMWPWFINRFRLKLRRADVCWWRS